MGEKLIQSYVKEQWFVSTIYRQSSAMVSSSPYAIWYYETLVCEWNPQTKERGELLALYDSGCKSQSAFEHHAKICAELPAPLRAED